MEQIDEEKVDLLDVLSTYQWYVSPTEENIKKLILQIGHNEIMQTRRYIALSWQNIFCHVSLSESFSAHIILNFYKCASPTGENVPALFKENCQRDQKKQCLKHLKGYINSKEQISSWYMNYNQYIQSKINNELCMKSTNYACSKLE